MAGFKSVLGALSIAMLIFGTIWILQGLSVQGAPVSFMTSHIDWTYRGAALDVAGLVLLIFAITGGWRNVVGGFGALALFIGVITLLLAYSVLPIQGVAGHAEAVPRGAVISAIGLVCTIVSMIGGKSAS